jgi:DUF1680 family protein
MINFRKSFLSSLVLAGAITGHAQSLQNTAAETNFVPSKYTEIPLGAIKPKGWLLHQLEIMRDGTSGHLDEVYGKVKNDNGWLGGKGDGWEETPYWLDGAVPLAYLLEGQELRDKVLKYINWTIDNQRPSGYFGPITKWERETGKKIDVANAEQGEDWWPKMVMLKVMQQYYLATNDKRVITFLTKYFNYQIQALPKAPIKKWTEWSESRGADNVLVVQWLYTITKQKELLKLAALIQQQSFPWSQYFYGRDWVIAAAAQQSDTAWMTRHGVNVAMGLKDPIVQYQRTGDKKYLQAMKHGFSDLMTLHGLPYGMFSADEDLHGNSPVQGTELCAITESMFSLEEAVGMTGDMQYMDALERMTFNALPTQTTDDYNNKQYFQIANQVHIKRGVFNFSLPFGREMNNVLGMRAGYTCCLANMHQGWTKFTSHLWYGTKAKGLAALHYSPNTITAKVGATNTEVTINETTNYPFEGDINFEITSKSTVSFPLEFRIPTWCSEAVILLNGEPLRKEKGGQIITINRSWKNGDKLTLQLPMQVTTSNWGKNSRTVERGPLVYALKIREDWQKENEPNEGDYFNVFPKDDWNYGLVRNIIQQPVESSEVSIVKPVTNDFIWNLEHAPIEIKVKARKIPEWKIVEDVAQQPITTREGVYQGKVEEKVETITLIPYGCTKVRIVAFPVVK